MTYQVRLTESAQTYLEQRFLALAENSPEAAERLLANFNTGLLRLRNLPLSCGFAYENHFFGDELRHLLFGTSRKRLYRAIFAVREDQVLILAIRAPGEHPIRPEDVGRR